MIFTYVIRWTDPTKKQSPYLRIGGDENMALYIAKKKLDEGMVDVSIDILKATEGKEDEHYPAIDAGGVE